jgi:ATP-binding cassette, subfamily B, bacterial MsbA
MKDFKRMFKYVWPQWPDIIVIVLSAVLIAGSLSLSFLTVIPLLKVMMGDEGIHGWAERKICAKRYGINFAAPDSVTQVVNINNLTINSIKKKQGFAGKVSIAEKAGLKKADVIVGVNQFRADDPNTQITRGRMLEELAAAPANSELVVFIRPLADNDAAVTELRFNTEKKPFYVDPIENLLNLLPRQQSGNTKTKAIVLIILGITVITTIRCAAKYVQEYMTQKVVQTAVNHLREDTFSHALRMPMGFFSSERPSDTVSRIIRDSDVMSRAVKAMLGKALREPLSAIAYIIAALWLNWQLTLIFMIGAPFVLGLLTVFGKKMKRASRKSLVAGSQMLAKLQEAMSGLKVVKVYNQYKYECDTFETINDKLLKQSLKMSKVDAATMPVLEVLGMIAGAAALIAGAYWVSSGKIDSPEDFFGLLLLLGAAAESARKTSDVWNKIQEANAAAERVFAVMDSPVEFEAPDALELPAFKRKIEFKDVVFTYPGACRHALDKVNLAVDAGQTIALVGPNGSGKTTLANLIPRFYDPDSGQVLIDGKDIRQITLSSLRSQIGMVTQNVVTFNDTIGANIAYGRPDATQQQVVEAARRAFAHEFIAPLPKGYETIIGEDGTGLSGGQLQRIVIARAILKNPAILIFDEATSQVDADSEAKIHKAIEEVMRGRTSFIIAHRFSTVVSADVIVVMDNGQIIAQGKHEQLIKTCRLYQSLYETQLVGA